MDFIIQFCDFHFRAGGWGGGHGGVGGGKDKESKH